MTVNEKPKTDFLFWWLVIDSLITIPFAIVIWNAAMDGYFYAILSILAIITSWILWRKEQRRIAFIISGLPIIFMLAILVFIRILIGSLRGY
jgi:hypothetical protein